MWILGLSRQLLFHLNDIIRLPAFQALPKFARVAISRIRRYQTILQALLSHFTNQIQSQFRLGPECNLLWNAIILSPSRILNLLLRKIQRPVQGRTRFLCLQIPRYHYLDYAGLSSVHTMGRCSFLMALINFPIRFINSRNLYAPCTFLK